VLPMLLGTATVAQLVAQECELVMASIINLAVREQCNCARTLEKMNRTTITECICFHNLETAYLGMRTGDDFSGLHN
jgi:hypothetical protein